MNPQNGLLELLILLGGSTLPMIILIGLGYLSRKTAVFRDGDVRVFSSYVYYFALPSLFISNLKSIPITADSLMFICTAFGSVVFFGIPYITFTFPSQ
ncbi:MAG: AEC family transporter, partial [Spirochaetaceae bacterium]